MFDILSEDTGSKHGSKKGIAQLPPRESKVLNAALFSPACSASPLLLLPSPIPPSVSNPVN